jgi:hypothetical protein
LTRKRRSFTGYTQLWMAPDHLLLVQSLRIVERYKRFAFRDIEAIVITDAADAWGLRALAILAAAGWGSIGLAVSSYGARAFFWVTALIGVAFVVLDIARGPRRKCVLKTAITSEQLRPVSRKKIADEFLAVVSQAVESVQGAVVAPEEVGRSEPAPIQMQASAPEPPPHEPPAGRGYIAEILFVLLLLDAVLVWVGIRAAVQNATGLLPTIYLAELIFAGVLAFRRSGDAFLRILAAFVLLFCIVDISTVSGVVAFKEVMNTTREPQDRVALNSLFFSQQATAIAAVSWRIVIGVIGVAKCLLDRLVKPK